MDKNFPYQQIVVVGGTGQVGHRVLELLVANTHARVVATSRAVAGGLPAGPLAATMLGSARGWTARVTWGALDLEADSKILAGQLEQLGLALEAGVPTALIFAAAFTNVDACEADPARCRRVNEHNTIAVLDWARVRFGAKPLFYSTDYVFDGAAGPYREDAPRSAISHYGQSKVAVEEWLEARAPGALIVRTTGVYDYLAGSKNFVMNMIDLWRQDKTTRLPSDQLANPVWARELAQASLELLARGASGVFHAAGSRQLRRSDFALLIARVFGTDPGLIVPVLTSELGQKARRPLLGGLTCERLRRELGWAPGAPDEILERLKR